MLNSILSRSMAVRAALGFIIAAVLFSVVCSRSEAVARPAYSPSPVLLYRHSPVAALNSDGLSVWVLGDGKGGIIRLRAMASSGQSVNAEPRAGAVSNPEPLWPAWISDPIHIDYTGWKKIAIIKDNLTFRPAADGSTATWADADTVGIETNRRFSALYIDDYGWGGVTDTDPVIPIDNFEHGIDDWRVHGSPDAIESVKLMRGRNESHSGYQSLRIDFSEYDAKTQAALNVLQEAIDSSNSKLIVFQPLSPFERETADALPRTGEAARALNAFGCPGEVVPVTFCLYSLDNLTGVTVSLKSVLDAGEKSISASDMDIHVVKLLKQHGSGSIRDLDATSEVGAILVKDDREALNSGQKVTTVGPAVADIPANTQRQYWVTVKIPANQAPGEYVGKLSIKSDQGVTKTLPIALKVLDLHLLSASKQYAAAFDSELYDGDYNGIVTHVLVTSEEYAARLSDMAAHGFKYSTVGERGDNLWKAMDIYDASGMARPFLNTGFTSEADAENVDIDRLRHHRPYFYYFDRNDMTLTDDVKSLSVQKMQAAAVLKDDATAESLAPLLSLAIYPIDHSYVTKLAENVGNRAGGRRDWLLVSGAQADPYVDRFLCGYLLWRTNMYGVMLSDYETNSSDYLDDTKSVSGRNIAERPQLLTYPVQDGLLSTLDWEACREGVTDVGYWTTFYGSLRECKDAKVAKALTANAEAWVNKFFARQLASISDEDLDAAKLKIAHYSIDMQNALDVHFGRKR